MPNSSFAYVGPGLGLGHEIVDVFKREQLSTEVHIAQLAVGAATPRLAKKTVEKERKIQELKDRFNNQIVSFEYYISGSSAHSM